MRFAFYFFNQTGCASGNIEFFLSYAVGLCLREFHRCTKRLTLFEQTVRLECSFGLRFSA
jgi:hypothetical protein